jgi:hypothetical protein
MKIHLFVRQKSEAGMVSANQKAFHSRYFQTFICPQMFSDKSQSEHERIKSAISMKWDAKENMDFLKYLEGLMG